MRDTSHPTFPVLARPHGIVPAITALLITFPLLGTWVASCVI